MKFPSLAGAVILLCCLSAHAGEPLVFEFKHSSPQILKQILDSNPRLFADPPLESSVDGQKLLVRGADEKSRERLAKLVEDFDVPQVPIRKRFIKLAHASAEKAAEFLNKALAPQPPAEGTEEKKAGGEDVPIQIVPATRTNEIFVLGCVEDVKLVESLVRAIDTDPPPVFK